MDVPRSEYVWIQKELVSENDKIHVSNNIIVPCTIILPLLTNTLGELVSQLEGCLKHNLIPFTSSCCWYNNVLALSASRSYLRWMRFAIATGPPGTGKTTAIRAGLSLFGCANNNMFVKGTNQGFLEKSSISALLFGIDDPGHAKGKSRANHLDIPELVVNLYNSAPTTNFNTGILVPMSLPILATNFDTDSSSRYVDLQWYSNTFYR